MHVRGASPGRATQASRCHGPPRPVVDCPSTRKRVLWLQLRPDCELRDHEPLGVEAAIKLARGERSAALQLCSCCHRCSCCHSGNTLATLWQPSASCWSSRTDGLHPTKAQHVAHTARPCCSLQKEAALRVVSAEMSISVSRSGPCSCRARVAVRSAACAAALLAARVSLLLAVPLLPAVCRVVESSTHRCRRESTNGRCRPRSICGRKVTAHHRHVWV